jgi:vacuolar-type H+-ATPase subunit H
MEDMQMNKKTYDQILRDFERILKEKSKEIIKENRKEVHEMYWRSNSDLQREVHDFYQSYV